MHGDLVQSMHGHMQTFTVSKLSTRPSVSLTPTKYLLTCLNNLLSRRGFVTAMTTLTSARKLSRYLIDVPQC